ncbi:MAG: helix-turn-helix transcriptional regulator [Mariprofundales bacterium]|nr:helix-turn-helix transcriptional regulator [Mariprofundales bacterium]
MSELSSKREAAAQASREDVRRMVTIEVGQRLRLAREEQKLSLTVISDRIKLRTVQLEALESGDWQALPHGALAVAFLRQYADFLNVNIDETLQQLKSESLGFHHPLTFPDPAIAPNRRWATAAALLFVLLLLVWNLFGSNADNDTPPVSSQPSLPAVSHTTLASSANSVTSAAQMSSQHVSRIKESGVDQSVSASMVTREAQSSARVGAQVEGRQRKREPGVKQSGVAQKSVLLKGGLPKSAPPKRSVSTAAEDRVDRAAAAVISPAEHPVTPPALPVTARPHEFSFHAAQDRVWLLIELPDGKGGLKRFREVIIRPHHSIEVVRDDGLLFVSVGNAGAIKITYEGRTLYDFGEFGHKGMVIRHHKIAVAQSSSPAATER